MITIANANALHIPLPDRSVQCIVTSPPYYGLRDYGTAKWEGGSAECDHVANPSATKKFGNPDFNENRPSRDETKTAGYFKDICPRCGARRIDAQIGLESTPAAYVANIVAVMRECRRVLKDDGVLFLNLGDSYFGDSPTRKSGAENFSKEWDKTQTRSRGGLRRSAASIDGLKPKDLIGIPWRVAFALQDDGWYLRDAIIWAKAWQDENMELDGSTMPGSQQDRCTSAYEFVFMLSKRQRYYWDGIAIKTKSGAWPRNVWRINTQNYSGAHFATFPPALIEPMILAGTSARGECPHCGKAWVRVVERNRITRPELPKDDPRYRPNTYNGSYEDINGKGDAGYTEINTIGLIPQCACYPNVPAAPELPDMPDNADPPKLCSACDGTGQIEALPMFGETLSNICRICKGSGGAKGNRVWHKWNVEWQRINAERIAIFERIKDMDLPVLPQTILDPFAGSGTTGAVAVKYGRRAVLLDLNTKYIDLQFERTNGVQMTMPE